MEAEIPTFRKGCVTSLVVMLTLGLVTLILAPTTGSYRGFHDSYGVKYSYICRGY